MSLISLEYVHKVNGKDKKSTLEFSKELLEVPYIRESLFVIKVDGESMQPLIQDKSLVVADLSQTTILNEKIYLVYKNNRMWIKQSSIKNDKINFISLNKSFEHLIFNANEVRVVARVLLTFTKL